MPRKGESKLRVIGTRQSIRYKTALASGTAYSKKQNGDTLKDSKNAFTLK